MAEPQTWLSRNVLNTPEHFSLCEQRILRLLPVWKVPTPTLSGAWLQS